MARFRLRPLDGGFFELFATLAGHLVGGTTLLAESLSSTADLADLAGRMHEAETAADATTAEIVRRLNSTFVTPLDREDIYRLAAQLDEVMDLLEGAVDMIHLYEVKQLPPEVARQVEVLQRCAELTAQAMPRLGQAGRLAEYWIEVTRLERSGDKAFRRLLAKLFSGDYKAIELLKIKDIVECLEKAIDGFSDVADLVEQIAVKES
ncbi:MAG: DUF47 family protein [Nocardioides sp.]|jgi:predicted phosphate transport protein (TIGR00153 family)